MTYMLSLPVRKSELINTMLSRAGLEYLDPEERRQAVQRVTDAAGLVVSLAPDCLKEVKVRTR